MWGRTRRAGREAARVQGEQDVKRRIRRAGTEASGEQESMSRRTKFREF